MRLEMRCFSIDFSASRNMTNMLSFHLFPCCREIVVDTIRTLTFRTSSLFAVHGKLGNSHLELWNFSTGWRCVNRRMLPLVLLLRLITTGCCISYRWRMLKPWMMITVTVRGGVLVMSGIFQWWNLRLLLVTDETIIAARTCRLNWRNSRRDLWLICLALIHPCTRCRK